MLLFIFGRVQSGVQFSHLEPNTGTTIDQNPRPRPRIETPKTDPLGLAPTGMIVNTKQTYVT